MKICMEDSVQKVLDIFEKDDGRTFEIKKEEAIRYLKNQEDTLLAERLLDVATSDEVGRRFKERFWQRGERLGEKNGIVLRKVQDTDKDIFIELQKENAVAKSMMKEEAYRNMLWNEHIEYKALTCSIEVDGKYVGYCGIKNMAHEQWEIAIEILKHWNHKGIGYVAVSMMLDEIKQRLDITEFRVRIDPDNYASQGLFEKLGAVPNGISEFMLHKEEDINRCEDENIHLIDDKMIELANKFNVEPRKLLSHVLEYKLVWK